MSDPGDMDGHLRSLRPARLLKPADLPDNFTRSLYKIAPYKGCAHGCRYCDGRAERYYVEGDFEKDIQIRESIPTRLEAELPFLREKGMIAFGSGVTDSYQELESNYDITGRCAKLLSESPHPQPALIMTKSRLVLRDLELWKRLNERAGFVLLVSLTSLDETLRANMEPGASSFASRLEVLERFKNAGCTTGVLAMPLLPGLSDSTQSIQTLYAACLERRIDFIMPGGLTLRPGRQKEFYLHNLQDYYPGLIQSTSELYRAERPSGIPHPAALRDLHCRLESIRKEFAIPALLPHRIFAKILPPHDSIRVLFRDMIELFSERGINTSALSRSAAAYDLWLLSLRRAFRKKRKFPPTWLDERFHEAESCDEIDRVLGNKKLASFTKAVLRDGARLNYTTLKLEPS